MRGFLEKVIKSLPKLSNEQLKSILLEISDEHQLLTSLLDSLATGIVIVDKEWKILQVNKFAERTLFSGVIDDSKYENEPVWTYIEENEIADYLKDVCKKNISNTSEEFSISLRDGTVKFIFLSVIPFVSDGVLNGNIIKIEDITQKRKKEVYQRRMENMKGLTNIAAEMAHEIKNPLGAISIHIQLIQKAILKKREGDGLLPEKKFLEDHLDIVNQEIDNLNRKVMDFLFAVRPVQAKLELVNPLKIIQNLTAFFVPEFEKNDVSLVLNECNFSQKLLIDPKLFRDVVMNIAGNALQAIKQKKLNLDSDFKNQEKSKIEFFMECTDEKFILKISDNGCGMDEETASKVFEPYFTTKATGTGLGLTMAYKIIREFNGDISVESQKGEGTTFTIRLPVPQSETKLLS